MTRSEIEQQVREMMSQTFEIEMERLRPDAKLFEELNLDSIDAVDMVVKVQEITGRRVDASDVRRVRTVSDVVDILERHLQQGA